jgi:hypothetical protein
MAGVVVGSSAVGGGTSGTGIGGSLRGDRLPSPNVRSLPSNPSEGSSWLNRVTQRGKKLIMKAWKPLGLTLFFLLMPNDGSDDNAIRYHADFDFQNQERTRKRIEEEDLPTFYVRQSDYEDIYQNTVAGFINRRVSLDSYDILTYAGAPKTSDERKAKRDRRDAAYGHMPNAQNTYSWDEYPYASTLEGGLGATIAEVPVWQQNIQKILLSSFYRANKMKPGSKFKVKLIPTETK